MALTFVKSFKRGMRSKLQNDEGRGRCVMGSTASHLHNMSSTILIEHVRSKFSVLSMLKSCMYLKCVHLSDTDRRKSSLFRKASFFTPYIIGRTIMNEDHPET